MVFLIVFEWCFFRWILYLVFVDDIIVFLVLFWFANPWDFCPPDHDLVIVDPRRLSPRRMNEVKAGWGWGSTDAPQKMED